LTQGKEKGRWMIGTFIRSMRLLSIAISVNLPAIYISVIGFDFEILTINKTSNEIELLILY